MGRSRGSCVAKADAIMVTSFKAFCSLAAKSILPMRGSRGKSANCLPIAVSLKLLLISLPSAGSDSSNSIAPNSSKSCTPSAIALPKGLSIKGKCWILGKRKELMRNSTAANELRNISGSVNLGRPR